MMANGNVFRPSFDIQVLAIINSFQQFKKVIIPIETKFVFDNESYEAAASTDYLSCHFKKILNKPFLQCLHEIRIYKAKSFLKEINLLAYEIANKVGYKDEKYFSQIFKKFTGMTPSEYREMCN